MTQAFKWLPDLDTLKSIFKSNGNESYYVVHEPVFKQNCEEFSAAFSSVYPNVRIAYSVKSNYLPFFIEKTASLGWFTEVVSGFEYELVKRLGIEGRNIIFNGPVKRKNELILAIKDRAIINVDSLTELNNIKDIVADHDFGEVNIGLRVNFDNKLNSKSRFGISSGEELLRALSLISETKYLKLNGLHAHYCFSGKKTARYTELASALVDEIFSHNLLEDLEYINLGGGFFSKMPRELALQWSEPIPDYKQYAQAILKPLEKLLIQSASKNQPQLILEPGLAVLADAMSFVCSVESIKHGNDSNVIILTGSVYNIKPTKSKTNMPFTHIPINDVGQAKEIKAILSGYTCMEDDVIHDDFFGSVSEGDFFVFHNVGAYSNVLKPPFIRLSPSFFMQTFNGDICKIVDQEVLSSSLSERFGLS